MNRGWHAARWMRRFFRVALAACLASLLLIPTAGSAAAHARLEASDPPAGAVLTAQPETVILTFNEPVEVNDGAIEVFDDRFNRVDSGHVTSAGQGPSRLQIGLRPGLARGTYTVSWHASSGDTHPVSGTFQFSLGEQSVVRGT
ncbi:MAG: copper resistance CopC family protein, partial [Dermatophilaceae bacterium]